MQAELRLLRMGQQFGNLVCKPIEIHLGDWNQNDCQLIFTHTDTYKIHYTLFFMGQYAIVIKTSISNIVIQLNVQYDTCIYIYIYHIYLRKNAGTTYTSVCLQIMLFTKRKMWQKLHLYTHVKHRKPMVALGYSQSSDSCLNRALDSCPTTAPARPSTHRRHQRGYIEGLF